MKQIIILLSVVFVFSISFAEERLELKDQKDKESYGLGFQFGQNLKFQGVAINLDVYTSGIKDALGGKEPQMSQEDICATIMELQWRITAARQTEIKEKVVRIFSYPSYRDLENRL